MERKKRVIIIGAGGHGRELRSYVCDLSRKEAVELAGFVDERKGTGNKFATSVVLGDFFHLGEFLSRRAKTTFWYITAAGDNEVRREFVRKAELIGAANLAAWTLRHPDSSAGRDVSVGEGTCLAPGSLITTHTSLGRHCILNVHASVSHDCRIGDFTNINPGAVICGNVRIGAGCYIGAGATIIDKVTIGEGTIVGAGAVVISDLPAHVTAVGVPARIIKSSRTK